MSKQLVLVTGATGHIGFRTLVQVLESGYRARITTRKIAQVEKIKAAKSIQPFLNDLEYEEVPDITAPGAFDKALQGVDFVLHLASPIPDVNATGPIDVKKTYLEPAVQGTLSILKSAANSTTIKRVVITSSVAVLEPQKDAPKVSPEFIAAAPNPDEVDAEPWAAYRASKILAYHAAQEWLAANKPAWDLIDILPAYVQGKNELVTDWKEVGSGSNDVITEIVTGVQGSRPRLSTLVWVNDVAKLEVALLDTSKGKNGDRYIASYAEKVTWAEVLPIAKRLFPDAFEKGILSEGTSDSVPIVFDSATSTETFGIEFSGLETMVKSQIGHYVALKSAA